MFTFVSLGRLFSRRLAEAIKEAYIHAREFDKFDTGLVRILGSSVTDGWLREITAWEQDHTQPCPYEPTLQQKDMLKDIKLEMICDERANLLRAGVAIVQDSSMTLLLTTCIDVEQLQYVD